MRQNLYRGALLLRAEYYRAKGTQMKLISTLKKIIFSRISICALGIILQLSYLAALFWTLGTLFSYSYIIFAVIGFVVALYIINRNTAPEYKLIWAFTVLSFPVFGIMLYLFFGLRERAVPVHRAAGNRNNRQHNSTIAEHYARQAAYIENAGGCAVSCDNDICYYANGEELFPDMLEQLDKAQCFIFLEFFILQSGIMWDSILAILQRKAADGLDVRLIYDDMGCLMTLPRDYRKQLESKGIRCCVFGRLKPLWTKHMNHRDHRKMLIIDGETVITGGINLADEYINIYEKHGYWKDSAVMLKGSAAQHFTDEFLSFWSALCGGAHEEISPKSRYKSDENCTAAPFFDYPCDNELLAENIYLNMLGNAQRYAYITTPYLIPDNELRRALILAAKSGVDVRIITPHIPDKKFVYAVTRSNYRQLIEDGVRIYEFIPGFIHAKNFVSDDLAAVVGTVNLDFRSLYLHYECGVCLYDCKAVRDIRDDFTHTLKQCREITLDEAYIKNPLKRMLYAVLRFFSPLM